MDIRIKTTDYQITPEVSAYLDERIAPIEKLLGSDAQNARIEVELGRDGGNQRHSDHAWRVEINVSYPGGQSVRATNNAENINTAIDDAKEEAMRQLRGSRQASRDVMRRTGAAIKRFMRFGAEE